MANLAQFNLRPVGREEFLARVLLEDLISSHLVQRPSHHLALAVWYQKNPSSPEQFLLELVYSDAPFEGFVSDRLSLNWKTGLNTPPFVNLRVASIEYFSKLLQKHPGEIAPYLNNYEVLYFDKKLLTPDVLKRFNVITEPQGLAKGWYVSESEYAKSRSIRELLSLYSHIRPMFGLIKTEESSDFENCRGILHVEVGQKWVPLTPEGIKTYTYYNDYQSGRPVYLLFEGGALYEVLKFEVKTAPDYASRFGFLEDTLKPNDRYPEVYLRAVPPSSQRTA
jgi:hypothetical protein